MKSIASLLVLDGLVAPYAVAPAPDTTPARDTTTAAAGLAIEKQGKHTWLPLGSGFFQLYWNVSNSGNYEIGHSFIDPDSGPSKSLRSQLSHIVELRGTGGFTPAGYSWYAGHRADIGGIYCKICLKARRRFSTV